MTSMTNVSWKTGDYQRVKKATLESLSGFSRQDALEMIRHNMNALINKKFLDSEQRLQLFVFQLLQIKLGKPNQSMLLQWQQAALQLLLSEGLNPPKSKLSLLFAELFFESRLHATSCVREFEILENYCRSEKTNYTVPLPPTSDLNKLSLEQAETEEDAYTLLYQGSILEAQALSEELALSSNSTSLQVLGALSKCAYSEQLAPLFEIAQASSADNFEFACLVGFSVRSRAWLNTPYTHRCETFKSIRHLVNCYEYRQPLFQRLCEHVHEYPFQTFPSHLHSLAYKAACTRWLFRANQFELCKLRLLDYCQLSLELSQGCNIDALACLTDVIESVISRKSLPKLESRFFARAKLGSTALFTRLAYELGRERVMALLAPAKRKKRVSKLEEQVLSEVFIEQLSQLKGPMLKLGQHLSYMGMHLPAAQLSQLDKLVSESRPLDHEEIIAAIEAEKQSSLDSWLCEFDYVPIGVGSIGQVHRGRLYCGQEVAIKVQYPKIRNAIQNDFKALSLLSPLIKIFAPNIEIKPILETLRNAFIKETDYRQEAEMQERFREKWLNHEKIKIPKIFKQHCSDNLLVSEFIPGRSFTQFLDSSSEDNKDEAGRSIFEFISHSLFGDMFHADPNPGNFIFTDEHIYVVDFGSVKLRSQQDDQWFAKFARSLVKRDHKNLRKLLIERGLILNTKLFDFDYFVETMGSGTAEPFRQNGKSRFDHDEIRAEIKALYSSSNPNFAYFQLKAEDLLDYRLFYGAACLLAKLGCNTTDMFERTHSLT